MNPLVVEPRKFPKKKEADHMPEKYRVNHLLLKRG
jgi:hypothetical protein